ncbi:MAG: hypothetical protein WA003_08115 [Desulfuromonadaceae bacterium]
MSGFKLPAAVTAMTLMLFFAPPISLHYQGLCSTACAEEPWKQEFMEICAKTDEAMSFSKEELKMLLQRGEKLKPAVEALEDTPRKIYLKRLQKCMNLYTFVLESKEAEKKQ